MAGKSLRLLPPGWITEGYRRKCPLKNQKVTHDTKMYQDVPRYIWFLFGQKWPEFDQFDASPDHDCLGGLTSQMLAKSILDKQTVHQHLINLSHRSDLPLQIWHDWIPFGTPCWSGMSRVLCNAILEKNHIPIWLLNHLINNIHSSCGFRWISTDSTAVVFPFAVSDVLSIPLLSGASSVRSVRVWGPCWERA
jgi:hypothetical protein